VIAAARPPEAQPSAGPPGVGEYVQLLRAFWCIRLFDFLEMSMVVPSLLGLMQAVNGSTTWYLVCLTTFQAANLLFRPVLGSYVDRTGQIKKAYTYTVSFCVFSNLLYAVSPVVGSPLLVVVARFLSGLSVANNSLMWVYLGRVAKPDERKKWVTAFATSRSIGYFGGPSAAGIGVWVTRRFFPDKWTGDTDIFGQFALVGYLLAIGNVLCLWYLHRHWKEVPPLQMPPAAPPKANGQPTKPLTTFRFLFQPHVIFVLLGNFGGTFAGFALEFLIAPAGSALFGWNSSENYAVFAGIAVVVLAVQGLMWFYLVVRLEDRQFFLLGWGGVSLLLGGTVALWQGEISGWTFAAPLVFAEAFMPFIMNGSTALFMRLVFRTIPHRAGFVQAIFDNSTAIGPAVAPYWLWLSYTRSLDCHANKSGKAICLGDAIPVECIAGLSVFGAVCALGVLCNFSTYGYHKPGAPPKGAPPKPKPAVEGYQQLPGGPAPPQPRLAGRAPPALTMPAQPKNGNYAGQGRQEEIDAMRTPSARYMTKGSRGFE